MKMTMDLYRMPYLQNHSKDCLEERIDDQNSQTSKNVEVKFFPLVLCSAVSNVLEKLSTKGSWKMIRMFVIVTGTDIGRVQQIYGIVTGYEKELDPVKDLSVNSNKNIVQKLLVSD